MKDYTQAVENRPPSELDLIVNSLKDQLQSLNDVIGLLEDKVKLLDNSCGRLNGGDYPKNIPPPEPERQIKHVERTGLVGEFDLIGNALEYSIKRLGNEYSGSLQTVIDYLQKHI